MPAKDTKKPRYLTFHRRHTRYYPMTDKYDANMHVQTKESLCGNGVACT